MAGFRPRPICRRDRLLGVALGLAGISRLLRATLDDPTRVRRGPKKCKTCHAKEAIGNQYGAGWRPRHAKAFETLASDKAKKWAAEAGVGDPQTDEKCVKCHVTAHGVPETLVSSKLRPHGRCSVRGLPRGRARTTARRRS